MEGVNLDSSQDSATNSCSKEDSTVDPKKGEGTVQNVLVETNMQMPPSELMFVSTEDNISEESRTGFFSNQEFGDLSVDQFAGTSPSGAQLLDCVGSSSQGEQVDNSSKDATSNQSHLKDALNISSGDVENVTCLPSLPLDLDAYFLKENDEEEVMVLDNDSKESESGGAASKSKVKKGPPPELLPLGQSLNASDTSGVKPAQKGIGKSAKQTKNLPRIENSQGNLGAGGDVASVDDMRNTSDRDVGIVNVFKVLDPTIDHCHHCKKVDCCMFQSKGKQNEGNYHFCCKRCAQNHFKFAKVKFVNSREEDVNDDRSSLPRLRGALQDIVVEPDIPLQTLGDVAVEDTVSTGANGTKCSVESMIESAAKESLCCATCKTPLYSTTDALIWEAMEFCSQRCLYSCIRTAGISCNLCKKRVDEQALGKLCVRFGSTIRQFCSSQCLEEFKVNHKLCGQCQIDMTNKELVYCSRACQELNRRLRNKADFMGQRFCAVCKQFKAAKEELFLAGKSHWLCSEPCRSAFRFAHKVTTLTCGICSRLFDSKVLPRFVSRTNELGKPTQISNLIWYCSNTCYTAHLLQQRSIVSCSWCKVKKYNVDMIRKLTSSTVPSNKNRTTSKESYFCSIFCFDMCLAASRELSKKSTDVSVATKAAGPAPTISTSAVGATGVPSSGVATTSTTSGTATNRLAGPSAGNSTLLPLEIQHKVVTVPHQPKEMKNKSVWCTPSHISQEVQTDFDAPRSRILKHT